MYPIVDNRVDLTAHGDVEGRTLALDIIDGTMSRIDAARLAKDRVRLQGERLKVDSLEIDLSEVGEIYVLGAGKGVLQIAEALDQVLDSRISAGLVIEKRLTGMPVARERIQAIRRIEVVEAGHPLPDEAGATATRRMLEIAHRAGKGDLVFVCVQGGCSSLTTLPAPGLSLDDVRCATDVLLRTGADIGVLDAVRMGLTQLQGGALARHIHPATIVNLVVNDFVWSYPHRWREAETRMGWGPSVPVLERDRQRLVAIPDELKSSGIWDELPDRVRARLLQIDPATSALTKEDFEEEGICWHTVILADLETSAEAARQVAREMELGAMILSTALEGEAAEVGRFFAGLAKEIAKNGRPLPAPCVLIATGEMTVSVGPGSGVGGRNQECVLGAAGGIAGGEGIVIVSVGTDGTDGPTGFAGGIVDSHTGRRAKALGVDIQRDLRAHNTTAALLALDDAIQFNQPGDNVCDLSLILVR